MKKYLFTILLGAFGIMTIATPVLAATSVSFTPVNVSVRQGQTFNLTIGINPQGVKNYTAKTELHYPADLLEVKSFTFADSWMPLTQLGYDLTDNTNGVFIKTAGYPGGVSSAVTFGTISFLTKKSGNGTIALNSNSFVLDANNQNVLTGTSVQTAVAISAPAPIPTTQEPIPAEEPTEEEPASEEEVPVTQEPISEEEPVEEDVELDKQASMAATSSLTFDNVIVKLLVAIIVLGIVGYAIYFTIQKRRRKNSGKPR